MNTNTSANVSVYEKGHLQQGYSLEGDRITATLQLRGFYITIEMQNEPNENRPQASVKVCDNEIFNTEDHVLKAPEIVTGPFGALTEFAVLTEAHASIALDGQTQSAQNKE